MPMPKIVKSAGASSSSRAHSRPHRGAGAAVVGALLAALVTPVLGSPAFAASDASAANSSSANSTSATQAPNDAFAARFDVSPAERSGHSASATFVQVSASSSSSLTWAKKTMQAVNDQQAGKTSVEVVDATTGQVTSSFDLSAYFSKIDTASVYFEDVQVGEEEWDTEEQARLIVRGEHDGAAALAVVASKAATAFEAVTVSDLAGNAAIDLPTLQFFGPAGAGLMAVNETQPGTFVATRFNYNMEVNAARPAVTLGFSHVSRVSFDSDSGNFIGFGSGEIVSAPSGDPASITTTSLPGFGQVTTLLTTPSAVLASDGTDKVAVLSTKDLSLQNTIALPGVPSNLAVSQKLGEVQATSTDGGSLWRYTFDGTERGTIDFGAAKVQPGSLSASLGYYAISTFTANVGGESFRYTSEYRASFQITHIDPLTATERGAGVNLVFVSRGAEALNDDTDYFWEYSLDGGANWAGQTEGWDAAKPDAGTTVSAAPALAAPLDGVAPFTRTDLSDEGVISTQGSAATMQEYVLPEGSYDGLWRVRVTNGMGSIASEPQHVTIGNAAEDTSVRFTKYPTTVAVTYGQQAPFDVTVAGDPKPTVKWQIQRPNKAWEDLKVTGESVKIAVELTDDKSLVRAVASNGAQTVESQPAKLSVLSVAAPAIGAAPAGAVKVGDAEFAWDLNKYSHEWARDSFGDAVKPGAKNGFVFSGGSGWVDAANGAAQMVFNGTAIYRPYGGMNGLDLTFANPYLAVGADGRGTLTADVFWNNGGGMGGSSGSTDSRGFKRVVVATYTDAKVTVADGKLSFAATPEWNNRPYIAPGLEDPTERPSSYPRSFVDYLDQGLRGWFLATGNRNDEKAGLPVTISATVSADAASAEGAAVSAVDPLGDGAQHFANFAPRVTGQPQSVEAFVGDSASLTAGAEGLPAPTVVWQRQVGSAWVNIDGATKLTLQLTKLEQGTFVVRALFKNSVGETPSDAATVKVAERPVVVPEQPTVAPAAPAENGEALPEALQQNARVVQSGTAVTISGLTPQNWYYVTVFSDPQGLGWLQASDNGTVSIDLAKDVKTPLEAGAHRVAAQAADGKLQVWGDVSVAKSDGQTPNPNPGTDPAGTDPAGTDPSHPDAGATPTEAAAGVATVTGATLARTGSQGPAVVIGIAVLLVLAGAAVLLVRLRKNRAGSETEQSAVEQSVTETPAEGDAKQ